MKIENEQQALERFKDTWPKTKVLDRVGKGTRTVGGQQLSAAGKAE